MIDKYEHQITFIQEILISESFFLIITLLNSTNNTNLVIEFYIK